MKSKMRVSLAFIAVVLVAVLAGSLWAQQKQETGNLPDAPRPQNNAPDAPSAVPSPSSLPPATTPAPRSESTRPTSDQTSNDPAELPENNPEPGGDGAADRAPMPPIRTAQPGRTPADTGSREQMFTLSRDVNFVTVPVTVRDADNRPVTGLLADDFSVYENGVRQSLQLFTSDPFPLSAAVVIDLAMSNQTVDKVKKTLPSLTGAFGQFDELAMFTFGSTVKKVSSFTGVGEQLSEALRQVRQLSGRNPGPPVIGGPLGVGPTVSGRPVDPGTPHTPTVVRESSVLNDAILAAARELADRDRSEHWQKLKIKPRKIVFVVSEGREEGSRASYEDVMKVLLSNDITVYAIAVGGSAIPGYGDARKFRIPGFGYGNILPKYASATGGQVFSEFSQRAIETAYGEVTATARNQYTLGYTTRASRSTTYRTIEVRVKRPNLKIYARDGYYPLPPARRP